MDVKWCPFMDKPCVGKMCACAVYRYSQNVKTWKCGMVAHLEDDETRNTICIEDFREGKTYPTRRD